MSDLLSPKVQDFISNHLNDNVEKLLLKGSNIEGVSMNLIVDQIISKRKAKTKLPIWFGTDSILYPPPLSLEQCSSEQAARFKSNLFSGEKALDLTGGTGVDTYFISKSFESLDYIEKSKDLSGIAKYNFETLKTKNINIYNSSAEKFLSESGTNYDLIYVDPSRRKDKGKVFQLQDCEPDVIDLQQKFRSRAKNILIKTSPILDIKKTLNDLKNVVRVIVLSLHNEVKEVLYHISWSPAPSRPEIVAVNILKGGGQQEFAFEYEDERRVEIQLTIPSSGDYLYEPNASILKAGAFKSVSRKWNIYKLHGNTHLYTSSKLIANFQGKSFKIVEIFKSLSEAKKKFRNHKLNIITRNYKMKPEEIKTKLGSRDGGNDYLIGTTIADASKKLYYCSRVV